MRTAAHDRHAPARRTPVLLALATGLLLAATAAPASAATTTTTTTFTLSGGALAITAPAAVNLGSFATGTLLITGQLGAVTVTDNRGALVNSWAATVSTSTFTTGGGSAAETVPKAAVDYWSGPATATTGTGVFTPGLLASVNQVPLTVSVGAFSATATVGDNSATWNPTLVIAVPAAAVVGTYSGTITHSVA